jgi:hypothetical protein
VLGSANQHPHPSPPGSLITSVWTLPLAGRHLECAAAVAAEVIGVEMDAGVAIRLPCASSATWRRLCRVTRQPGGHQFRPERTPALSPSLFGLGDLIGYEIDESTGRCEPFFISSRTDLAEAFVYATAAAAQGDSK